jgi:aldehyde dehydrogenase (NAD+)
MSHLPAPLDLSCLVAGQKVQSANYLPVHSPFDRRLAGRVALAGRSDTEAAIRAALAAGEPLTRFRRSEVLDRARHLLEERREEFAHLILSEAGLCLRETRYEVGRACDVLRFAAIEALRDDGQIFSCDVSKSSRSGSRSGSPSPSPRSTIR